MEKHISQLISSINQSPMDGKDSLKSNLPTKADTKRELNMPIGTIHKAWNSKKLSECTDGEIATRLSLVYFMIGLRPKHFPSKEEDIFLFNYIRKKFGRNTIDELYLAFDLAINDKLDIDDVKVYDQFSIEYLVRIMNSYRRYANHHINEYNPPIMIENKPKEISKEEKLADIRKLIDSEKIVPSLISTMYFDWMVELGFINHNDEDKARLYGIATRHRYSELRNAYEKNPTDKSAKQEYHNYKELMKLNFAGITDKEIFEINRFYKLVSIVETIIKIKNNERTNNETT